ncbi:MULTISPECIES: hypothetical protein [Halobacterium]|uniref:hypothetical protein n=1 Tax=Halobacterium TaxID=2239 RepID=UPI001964F62D|nr:MULTISPECIES: hypothetical protein [Halobacterium]MCF2207491.1 hypothetical protein [Halobacterium salinarum]MCF2240839.1 hypothetical protein [Halobacterium salinarum]MDL0122349.1 hypothetical protein [Halobacterium salinarum]QRY24005.1 hypothetical protein JRZ79_06190 [Halobacterium sp. BOL4-2]
MKPTRKQRLGSVFIVVASAFMIFVSALIPSPILVVISVLIGIMGVIVYVGIQRYETEIERLYATPIDYTSPLAFATTVVQAAGLTVVLSILVYVFLIFDMVAPVSEWGTTIDSLAVIIGAVLGVVLGAGFPPLMQQRNPVPWVSAEDAKPGMIVMQLNSFLLIVAFVALLFGFDPLSALVYCVTYFGSRLAILGSMGPTVLPERSHG